jgi:hypothetical protein
MVFMTQNAPALPLIQETINTPFIEYPNAVLPEIRFLPLVPGTVYCTTFASNIERDGAGGVICVGPHLTSATIITEVPSRIGAINIMGTTQMEMIGFFAAASDYIIIGEELYAIASLLGEDETMMRSISAQDVAKYVVLGLVIVGLILGAAGVAGWADFIKM